MITLVTLLSPSNTFVSMKESPKESCSAIFPSKSKESIVKVVSPFSFNSSLIFISLSSENLADFPSASMVPPVKFLLKILIRSNNSPLSVPLYILSIIVCFPLLTLFEINLSTPPPVSSVKLSLLMPAFIKRFFNSGSKPSNVL